MTAPPPTRGMSSLSMQVAVMVGLISGNETHTGKKVGQNCVLKTTSSLISPRHISWFQENSKRIFGPSVQTGTVSILIFLELRHKGWPERTTILAAPLKKGTQLVDVRTPRKNNLEKKAGLILLLHTDNVLSEPWYPAVVSRNGRKKYATEGP